MPDNYLPQVRSQYEALPYPPCNPEDDRQRLVLTWLEDLPMINHYCFAGKQSFQKCFRALVAGGGTGDATIFLAEQLRASNAEIVHLDMSEASIALAKERARIRGLTNISWVHDSLLNLPALGARLGKFDYINCSGVLHHLADPDLGLRTCLRSIWGRASGFSGWDARRKTQGKAARLAWFCNAADRPKSHLPCGLGRNRAIYSPNPLHGHQPMLRDVGEQLIPIASQRDPK